MTVNVNEVVEVTAAGNGVTTVWPFNFTIYESTDLAVAVTDADGVITNPTVGTGPTNYSISVSEYPSTGSITYPADTVTPLPSGWTITIAADYPIEQQLDLENQGGYFPEEQEVQFDKLVRLVKQLEAAIARCVQVQLGDATDPADLIAQLTADAVAAAAAAALVQDALDDLNLIQATEGDLGVAMLATIAKIRAFTDDLTIVTPLKLASVFRYGTDIVAANTITAPLDAAWGGAYDITGNTQINTFPTGTFDGERLFLRFTGTPILSTSGNLVPPGGASYTCVAGVMIMWIWDLGATKWRAIGGMKADGSALVVAGATQKLVAYAYAEYTTNGDLTTALPVDDTAPVISEGTQILSQSITTTSATQVVEVEVNGVIAWTASTAMAMSVWRGSTCVAFVPSQPAAGAAAAGYAPISVIIRDSPASASSLTYTVRVGATAGGAGSCRMNGTVSGRLGNGLAKSTLTLKAIEP